MFSNVKVDMKYEYDYFISLLTLCWHNRPRVSEVMIVVSSLQFPVSATAATAAAVAETVHVY